MAPFGFLLCAALLLNSADAFAPSISASKHLKTRAELHKSTLTFKFSEGRNRALVQHQGHSLAARNRGRYYEDDVEEEKPSTFSITTILILINLACYGAQIASSYEAVGKIEEILTAAGRSMPPSGLPFSLPQFSLPLGRGQLSAQGAFTRDFIMLGPMITQLDQSYRYLSSAFLHGGILHLGMNMYNLNHVGRQIEVGLQIFVYACLTFQALLQLLS